MTQFPADLYDFAFTPVIDDKIQELATLAEAENWNYSDGEEGQCPILKNYIRYTYKRISEEGKISLSSDGQYACWNTGLVTESQEPIYVSYSVNRNADSEPWYFSGWYRRGEWQLSAFDTLPEIAHYFDDPSVLVMDTKKDFRVNVEHIVEDNKARFPAPYNTMDNYQLQTILKGVVENAKSRVKRNYKAAIPQYYNGKIQLMLPLCLSNPRVADLALVVERYDNFYRSATCLTLDMAYNNARQLAKPDRDWLQP